MRKTPIYKTLENTLLSLGFQKVVSTDHVLFRNPDYDAVVVLPVVSPMMQVRPFHLVSVRETVVRKGIADQKEFNRILYSSHARAKRMHFASVLTSDDNVSS